MKILLGIVIVHFLVILRAKLSESERVPYATIFILTAIMVLYVVAMLFAMEPPE